MRNTLLSLTAFVLTTAVAQAQSLQPPPSLNYGTVSEVSDVTAAVVLPNAHTSALRVDSVKLFEVYGAGAGSLGKPFTSNFTAPVSINPGSSYDFVIRMNPRHNVQYASVALLCGQGFHGCRAMPVTANVVYRKGYYATSQNLWGQALFTALQARLRSNYQTFSYNAARDQMFMTVDNKRVNGQGASTNTLECIYSGTLATGYSSRSDAQTRFSFNTEHTMPQSLFGSSTPMQSDLHHLFPTLDEPNNRRGNLPLDTVVGTPTYQLGGSKLGGGVFEPRAVQKGRSARALLYFAIRHQDYNGFIAGKQPILRRWALTYLPDSMDLKRNTDVQAYQGNRNPFTDYPQLLERLPSVTSPGQAFPVVQRIQTYPLTIQADPADTSALWFAIVNEGNTEMPYTLPAPPTGFSLIGAASGSVAVGSAAAFRLVPQSLTQNVYTYNAAGTPITILVGPMATRSDWTVNTTLRVSPNPAHGQVKIDVTGTATVFNAYGQVVTQTPAGSIDIAGWVPGVYIVRANGQTARLVVQ